MHWPSTSIVMASYDGQRPTTRGQRARVGILVLSHSVMSGRRGKRTRVQVTNPVDRARDHHSITEAGLAAKDKNVKKVYGMYTLVQKEDNISYNLFRQQCPAKQKQLQIQKNLGR